MPHSSSWLSSGRARGRSRPPFVYRASQSGHDLNPYPLQMKHLQMKCLFFWPSNSFAIGFKSRGTLMCPIPAQNMHCCFDRPKPPQVQQGRGRNSHPGFPKSDPGYSFWNRTRVRFGFPSSLSTLCFHQAKTGTPTLSTCTIPTRLSSEPFHHLGTSISSSSRARSRRSHLQDVSHALLRFVGIHATPLIGPFASQCTPIDVYVRVNLSDRYGSDGKGQGSKREGSEPGPRIKGGHRSVCLTMEFRPFHFLRRVSEYGGRPYLRFRTGGTSKLTSFELSVELVD